ncbi:lysoplasmalogenase [Spirochaeta africana]|uniref:Putative membrane protein n=1 Tax=Spirochaeta africana (strain ATCC 700263 / DSM 8902 / Z-7692) TaxID=889378 RepID=H9UMY0_SPIAZ|nr:lysoplasmalogenase [Spirochaeta africana]AFG38873.1 putative membrane protein [Spirochaeta africana DSM 8902]
MNPLLLLIPLALAVPAVVTGHLRTRGREYLKVSVTLSLLVIVVLHGQQVGWTPIAAPFAASLLCAAVADYLLSTQRKEWYFLAGLAGFLVAYAIYGIVLHRLAGLTPAAAVLAAFAAAALILQYRTMRKLPPEMKLPVLVYMLVVSHLVVAAGGLMSVLLTTRPLIGFLAVFAAANIYASDSFIAHNIFRAPLKHDELWILPTYYAAQIAMTAVLLLW